jgi:hypothetical protein
MRQGKESKRCFFEKKQQKTFAPDAAGSVRDHSPRHPLAMARLDRAIHACLAPTATGPTF